MIDTLDAFTDIAEDIGGPVEPLDYWICPRDKNPAPELSRQATAVAMIHKLAPEVLVAAVPNGGKDTDWSRLKKVREGMHPGFPDLVLAWNRGMFFAEFKDGQWMPKPSDKTWQRQCRTLNALHRMGWRVGVYREPVTLLRHLREAGAPVREARF